MDAHWGTELHPDRERGRKRKHKLTRGYAFTFGGTDGSMLGRRGWLDAGSKGWFDAG